MEIGKVLEAFRFGTLQECRSVILKLEGNGISHDEFFKWLGEEGKRIEPLREFPPQPEIPHPPRRQLRRRCPECGAWMRVFSVNDKPGNMVGGAWRSQWLCTNRKCYWDEYSIKSVREEAESYIVEE